MPLENKRKLAKKAKIFHKFLTFRLVSLLQIKGNRKLKFALPMVYYVDDV